MLHSETQLTVKTRHRVIQNTPWFRQPAHSEHGNERVLDNFVDQLSAPSLNAAELGQQVRLASPRLLFGQGAGKLAFIKPLPLALLEQAICRKRPYNPSLGFLLVQTDLVREQKGILLVLFCKLIVLYVHSYR